MCAQCVIQQRLVISRTLWCLFQRERDQIKCVRFFIILHLVGQMEIAGNGSDDCDIRKRTLFCREGSDLTCVRHSAIGADICWRYCGIRHTWHCWLRNAPRPWTLPSEYCTDNRHISSFCPDVPCFYHDILASRIFLCLPDPCNFALTG